MTSGELLAEMIRNQKGLTKWYLEKIPMEHWKERPAVNGKFLNSPFWIVSHLIWADDYLCLAPLGGETSGLDYAQKTGFGSKGELPDAPPKVEQLLEDYDQSMKRVTAFVSGLTDEELEKPYPLQMLGFRNTRFALYHLVRHEGVHCGQLSWFCAINGLKTV